MVVERQPPKDSSSHAEQGSGHHNAASYLEQHPGESKPVFDEKARVSTAPISFGQPTQLQSPLRSSNVFNIPKTHRPRPEHHRSTVPSSQGSQSSRDGSQGFRDPFAPRPVTSRPPQQVFELDDDSSIVEIKPPVPPAAWSMQRPPPPTFSSLHTGGFTSVSQPLPDAQTDGLFITDAALFESKFGDHSILEHVDSEAANKQMKALLEGAFGDDEDKPKTRGQRRKLEKKAQDMLEKMKRISFGEGGRRSQGAEDAEEEQGEEEEDVDDGTREGLKVKLLPHQIDGVAWMIARELGKTKVKGYVTKGGILADDMGLGKTIQTIALVLQNPRPEDDTSQTLRKACKSTLVVAPLALIQQWSREIEEKVEDSHSLRVLVHHGSKRTKRGEDLKKYDVVITTYQTVMSEHENSPDKADGPRIGCFGVHWYRVVLDEAHSIKNRNAKSTKACYALQSHFRWCLTGTPMQNHLDELHSLIHFLQIKPIESRAVWKDQIITPLGSGKGGLAIRRLQVYLKAFMKRRTKDVLKEQDGLGKGAQNANGFKLVNRKVEKIVAEFTPREREYYANLEQKADSSLERMMGGGKLSYASALTLLLRLRQACNHKELIKKSLSQDTDALTVKESSSQSPRKKAAPDQDVDDVANLLGGLSVEAKQCNVCMADLTGEEVASRLVRCTGCEADLVDDEDSKPKKRRSKKKELHRVSKTLQKTATPARRDKTRRVLDDSDEEAEGDWVVPENERSVVDLGKAGGTDDENAEGGGKWLGSEDSDTDDNSSIKIVSQRKKVISLETSDQSSHTESEEAQSASEEYDSDDSSAAATQVVASTKIRDLMKILRRECPSHKVIVYSQFTSMLDLIEPFLRKESHTYVRYDGRMRNDLREASLDKLRNDKRTRVLLCSLKCGSLGLNLTAASRVVILEPFWNPVGVLFLCIPFAFLYALADASVLPRSSSKNKPSTAFTG